MSLAKDLRDLVDAQPNREFARPPYRLSLNPVEDRFEATGFILWRDEDGIPTPLASGRALGDDLLIDDASTFPGTPNDLQSLLSSLIAGDELPTAQPPLPEDTTPTGA